MRGLVLALRAIGLVVALALLAACGVQLRLGDIGTSSEPAPGPGRPQPSADADADDAPMDEVVLDSAVPLTDQAEAAAREFAERASAAVTTQGWRHEQGARDAGFRPSEYDVSHWYHPEHLGDGVIFDPQRPEFLVVVGGLTVGVMFVPETMELNLPEPPGAPLMRWHYRNYVQGYVCTPPTLVQYRAVDGRCRGEDVPAERSPAMSYDWLYHREDPFAASLPAGLGEPSTERGAG